MKTHTFAAELWLPQSRDNVFRFFADAHNLQTLTPPWLNFIVLTPKPIEMRPGALIDYRLRIHGFPVRWQSEITAWEPPLRFVDVQRHGPYRRWIHTHIFKTQGNGTLCQDHVDYAVPGGSIVNRLIVRRDVKKIFRYRQQVLNELFRNKEK